jgi:hypothetical protein
MPDAAKSRWGYGYRRRPRIGVRAVAVGRTCRELRLGYGSGRTGGRVLVENAIRLNVDTLLSRCGLHSYVIDRLFRDAAGDRWIVDFKTSRHEGGGLEQFLDGQRVRYEPQLNAYAAAFARSRLGLYFPLLRGWREWQR